MKYILVCLVFLLAWSCKNAKTNSPSTSSTNEDKIENFDWLIGSWKRIDDKKGSKTYEYWTKENANLYIGMGCRLKNQDTTWQENVLLKKEADHWNFEVIGMGEKEATIFKVSDITKSSFICKNPQNEFPKVIEYTFASGNINAVISGGGPTIPFTFEPMKD